MNIHNNDNYGTSLSYMQLHYISCISTLKCEKSEAKNCISWHGSGIRLNSITFPNLCGHLVCVLLICGLNTTSEIKPSNIVLYRHVLSCRIQPQKKTNFLHKHVHTHTRKIEQSFIPMLWTSSDTSATLGCYESAHSNPPGKGLVTHIQEQQQPCRVKCLHVKVKVRRTTLSYESKLYGSLHTARGSS